MIFPNVRCSELEKDADQKRAVFEKSRDVFVEEAKVKAKPLALLKNNPKWILFTFFSVFSGWKILFSLGKKLLFKKKSNILFHLLKAGWFWKLAQVGMKSFVGKKGTGLSSIGLQLLKSLLKK